MTARVVVLVALAAACRRPAPRRAPVDAATAPEPFARPAASGHPAGATCGGRDDCAAGQVCVRERCRYRRTSVEGEILAAAARAQRRAGDARSARDTFARARAAFAAQSAPVPPEILCEAALASLACRDSPSDRERAAEDAARCLQGSLPSDPDRAAVLDALAALRHEGLRLSAFDEAHPARYFGAEATRPPRDAVEVAVTLPESGPPGLSQARQALDTDEARRVIRECFLRSWEQQHRREARARLVLDLATQARRVGDFEVQIGRLRVAPTRAEDGFEACVSRDLSQLLQDGPRLSRPTVWQLPFEVHAALR